MKAFWTLFVTEAKLAIRGGDMAFFGILFPVAVMLLIGFVSGPEAARLGFGGVAAVGTCAAGLMGIPLTLSNYRHAKILKRFRVTPVSPATLLAADALLQAAFAVVSATAVYLVASLLFGVRIGSSPARYALTFAFVLWSIFSLGFLVASLAPDVKSANLACTVLYFPMLFLSGATVPYEMLPRGLKAVTDWFPLTEGIKLLKGAVIGVDPARDLTGFIALAGVALVSYILSLAFFRWE